MKAEPMKRYLMQQLMPALAKAMVDARDQQAPDPVHFVAQQLLEVSTCVQLVRVYGFRLHVCCVDLFLLCLFSSS